MTLHKHFFILFLFALGISLNSFSQSKKKINQQLIKQHDSLVTVIQKNDVKVDSITLVCIEANQALITSINNFKTDESKLRFSEFKTFHETIETVKYDFQEESGNYLEKLYERYPLFNDQEYSVYCDKVNSLIKSTKNKSDLIKSRKLNLTNLRPNLILTEKTGNKTEWNEIIFSQNQSLKYFIELQDVYINNQIALAGYSNDEAKENSLFYEEFNQLMEKTQIEKAKFDAEFTIWKTEREKKEAERARLEALYWKKNKGKTIQFIPPVIEEEERNPIQLESQKGFDVEVVEPPVERIAPKQEPIYEKRQEEEIFTIVDEPAEYPGGNSALKAYLKENLLYPVSAREFAIEGKVYVRFIISKNGEISNVAVLRGIPDCIECDKEAIRLIKSMPKWKPSKINGKEVNSTYNLPITFKID